MKYLSWGKLPRRQTPLRPVCGMILSIALIIGLLLIGLAGGVVSLTHQQSQDRARYEIYKDEFAAAEHALNKAFSEIQFLIGFGAPDFFDAMNQLVPPQLEGYDFPNFDAVQTFEGLETVDSGQWEGLTLNRLRYRIDVTAKRSDGAADRHAHPGVSISQNLEITYVPLFIFAIFYDPILEIAPGPYMQVNGLVHSNSDTYVQSGSGLDFLKRVTVAGEIRHGRHPEAAEAVVGGDVRFNDGDSQVSMQRGDGDGWLTHDDADWTAQSTERWNGGLRDSSHGVRRLSLPIPNTIDPHAIIERADPANDSYSLQQEKFEYKAGLKILKQPDGSVKGFDSQGNEVSLSYQDPSNPSQTRSIVQETSFFDARENKTVNVINVDMSRMLESGIMPDNGILYVSNENTITQLGAVRLINGAQLPLYPHVNGFTVASDDPVYIKGDYNTQNKTMAMVAADALSILSNSWNDANSTNYSNRDASTTEVNAVCMNGIVASDDGNYSGGVENYFRFLEKWDGDTFRFSGSIINLWESAKAIGKWKYGSPIYTAPRREWSWDQALGGLNGPPGAPRVIEISKSAWEMRAQEY